jgi:hypothetical protein
VNLHYSQLDILKEKYIAGAKVLLSRKETLKGNKPNFKSRLMNKKKNMSKRRRMEKLNKSKMMKTLWKKI